MLLLIHVSNVELSELSDSFFFFNNSYLHFNVNATSNTFIGIPENKNDNYSLHYLKNDIIATLPIGFKLFEDLHHAYSQLEHNFEPKLMFNLSFTYNIQVNNYAQLKEGNSIFQNFELYLNIHLHRIIHIEDYKIFINLKPDINGVMKENNIDFYYIFLYEPSSLDNIIDSPFQLLIDIYYKKRFEKIDNITVDINQVSIQYVKQPEKYYFKTNNNSSVRSTNNTLILMEESSELINSYQHISCSLLGSADALILNKIIINQDIMFGQFNNSPRIFCGIFTTHKSHESIKVIKRTWGKKCDGFLAFSTIDDDTIPSIRLPHSGMETYSNMWQKSRSGDDMYYIIENLKSYLLSDEIINEQQKKKGVFLGRKLNYYNWDINFNSGGSGYILDQEALKILGDHLDTYYCNPDLIDSSEDLLVALCLRNVNLFVGYGIYPFDTRDHDENN
eukprot:gene11274-15126_t